MKPYFVYILRGKDDSLYTGITVDVETRLSQHNGDKIGGAKYTATRRPWRLVYCEECKSRSEASIREHEIKNMSHIEKNNLMNISHLKNLKLKVWQWPGDFAWCFVTLDKKLSALIRNKYKKGMIPIKITVGKSTWETSLLYHRLSEAFLIPIKKPIRKKESILPGDIIEIDIEINKTFVK